MFMFPEEEAGASLSQVISLGKKSNRQLRLLSERPISPASEHPVMSHKASVKIRFKRSNLTDSINSSTPMSISFSPSSTSFTSASPSASDRTAWWLQQQSSSSDSSQEVICQELIRKNVDKLGQLAEKCERLNSNLDKVVVESHKILDNSFILTLSFASL